MRSTTDSDDNQSARGYPHNRGQKIDRGGFRGNAHTREGFRANSPRGYYHEQYSGRGQSEHPVGYYEAPKFYHDNDQREDYRGPQSVDPYLLRRNAPRSPEQSSSTEYFSGNRDYQRERPDCSNRSARNMSPQRFSQPRCSSPRRSSPNDHYLRRESPERLHNYQNPFQDVFSGRGDQRLRYDPPDRNAYDGRSWNTEERRGHPDGNRSNCSYEERSRHYENSNRACYESVMERRRENESWRNYCDDTRESDHRGRRNDCQTWPEERVGYETRRYNEDPRDSAKNHRQNKFQDQWANQLPQSNQLPHESNQINYHIRNRNEMSRENRGQDYPEVRGEDYRENRSRNREHHRVDQIQENQRTNQLPHESNQINYHIRSRNEMNRENHLQDYSEVRGEDYRENRSRNREHHRVDQIQDRRDNYRIPQQEYYPQNQVRRSEVHHNQDRRDDHWGEHNNDNREPQCENNRQDHRQDHRGNRYHEVQQEDDRVKRVDDHRGECRNYPQDDHQEERRGKTQEDLRDRFRKIELSAKTPKKRDTDIKLTVNIFSLDLTDPKPIWRHNVKIELVDNKYNKTHMLSSSSPKIRGDRAQKLKDCFKMLEDALTDNQVCQPYVYDGVETLYLHNETRKEHVILPYHQSVLCLSPGLQESQKFLCATFSVKITPEGEPFVQSDPVEWNTPRFLAFLNAVTSHNALKNEKYVPQSKGLLVKIENSELVSGEWIEKKAGVHKGTRVIGIEKPVPVVQLDPHQVQHYAEIPLDEMFKLAFPKLSIPMTRRPDTLTDEKIQKLFEGLRVVELDTETGKWGSITQTIACIEFSESQSETEIHDYSPFAVLGNGENSALNFLRPLPYQSIWGGTLDLFNLVPKPLTPSKRWELLRSHFKTLGFEDGECVPSFGVTVSPDPFDASQNVHAEKVAKPIISFTRPVKVDKTTGSWLTYKSKFPNAAHIHNLYVLTVMRRGDEETKRKIKHTTEVFVAQCKEKNMKIDNVEECFHTGEEGVKPFLFEQFERLGSFTGPHETPFLILISYEYPFIHETLKYLEMKNDVPTQHIQLNTWLKIHANLGEKSKTHKNPYDLTLLNIISKANVKCGGVNYLAKCSSPLTSWLTTDTIMIGIDVAHPKTTGDGHPSVVGLSCNFLTAPFKFHGGFYFTDPKKEIVDKNILKKFVKDFYHSFHDSGRYPTNIIIFRDGVSDEEEKGAREEVKTLIESIHEGVPSDRPSPYWGPNILAIVVKKRHHTRFYAEGQGSSKANTLADTSMGGEVGDFGKRQLYIQAHHALQGTVKVPSFVVIKDSEDLPNKSISEIVCASCCLHQIADSPTSIPTPVYVAHELAKRGMTMFKANLHENGPNFEKNWEALTDELSYAKLPRLSKIRFV